MSGSKTLSERIFLMKTCFKIIFNSNWSKEIFRRNENDLINSEKLVVVNQSAKKNSFKLTNKLN